MSASCGFRYWAEWALYVGSGVTRDIGLMEAHAK